MNASICNHLTADGAPGTGLGKPSVNPIGQTAEPADWRNTFDQEELLEGYAHASSHICNVPIQPNLIVETCRAMVSSDSKVCAAGHGPDYQFIPKVLTAAEQSQASAQIQYSSKLQDDPQDDGRHSGGFNPRKYVPTIPGII